MENQIYLYHPDGLQNVRQLNINIIAEMDQIQDMIL